MKGPGVTGFWSGVTGPAAFPGDNGVVGNRGGAGTRLEGCDLGFTGSLHLTLFLLLPALLLPLAQIRSHL